MQTPVNFKIGYDERDIFLSELTERGFVFEEVVERSLS